MPFVQHDHVVPALPAYAGDAGMLFEETQQTMFCSDLFHQVGDVEPSTESDLIGRFRDTLTQYQAGPFSNYVPYAPNTERLPAELASLVLCRRRRESLA
jgi:hypothetical protein